MKPAAATILLLTLALSGCAQYRPSDANCFAFVSRGPSGCTFEVLDAPAPIGGRDG